MMDGRTAHIRAALDSCRTRTRARVELQHGKFASISSTGPFPRRGGLGAAVRRPQALSARRAIATRGHGRERPLRARGCRPSDGQARHDVDRSDPADRWRRPARASGAYQVSGELREPAGAARSKAYCPELSTPRSSRPGTCSAAPARPTSSPMPRGARDARSDCGDEPNPEAPLRARRFASRPGGVHSPVRAFRERAGGSPVFFAKGDGARLIDVDGKAYIDFCLAFGPLILGHGPRRHDRGAGGRPRRLVLRRVRALLARSRRMDDVAAAVG